MELINYLFDEDKEICDKIFIIDECVEVVYNMKLNKLLGLDGIFIEFYKMFWKCIKFYLYESFVRFFEVGELLFF